MYLGSWKIDDVITFYANTHRFDTGAATDADSVPAYRVYEDETGTAILTGNMALLDSSNTAGFYSEQITLSAANGFEKGKSYAVYISAAVNSVTGATHHTLQIEAEVDSNSVSNIGAGVITAAAIATGAIDADAVASDAVTEIQSGLSTLTAAGVRTAIGLASANLDTQLDALPTTAEVNAEVDTALADVGLTTTITGRIDAAISTRSTVTTAQVNAEVLDVLNVDTFAEPTGAPAATTTLAGKLGRLYQVLRNGLTVTGSTKTFKDDAGSSLWSKSVSDDGTTYTEAEGS